MYSVVVMALLTSLTVVSRKSMLSFEYLKSNLMLGCKVLIVSRNFFSSFSDPFQT